MNSLYAHIIVNPAAGAGKTGRNWPRIKEIFQGHGIRFDYAITEGKGHATELARRALQRGFETIIAVGGDGTINEIVNGMYNGNGRALATLGIVSTGTGADYIRTAGIPRHYRDACQRFLEPRRKTVDLGVIERGEGENRSIKLFANFAGMGFDAEIVRRTYQQFKQFGALPSYLLGTLTTLLTYHNKDISLTIDGKESRQRVCTVVMSNGRYGGGGMNTAPGADLDDGLLDVLVVGDLGKFDFIRSLPSIYRGTHLSHPKVTLQKAREIEVRSLNGRIPLQADGDLLGEVPARFRVLPGALDIIV